VPAVIASLLAAATAFFSVPAVASAAAIDPIVKARAAYANRDRATLVKLRDSTAVVAHPLAMWVDYWELSLRMHQLKQADVDAFYARWPGTAVEERLRKDWIFERTKNNDESVLASELPRIQFIEDRDRALECYALLQRYRDGENVTQSARDLWFAQREADHGCAQLAAALFKAGQFTRDDVWARARIAAEQGRRYVAQHAIGLLGTVRLDSIQQAFLHPTQYLNRRIPKPNPDEAELSVLAVVRIASRNSPAAAAVLEESRATQWPARAVASAWAVIGKEAAISARSQAFEWYQRAAVIAGGEPIDATADTLAWNVRAALRAENTPQRWHAIVQAVDAMSNAQRNDPTWPYWKARALQATAADGAAGNAQRAAAKRILERIANRVHYYGLLAAQELGHPMSLPEQPPALTEAVRTQAQNNPGLQRGIALFRARLRDEGNTEWRHTLYGMSDRSIRAAAQVACDAEIWTVCMTTSERTRTEIDMAQRFPTPYRQQVDAAALETGVDAARLYAVIRQESHFSVDARSIVGAAGLMQLMPQTARWVASQFRIPYTRERIHDPATNVRLGARYLQQVLREFDGSHLHAAAAYNAGPSRPRRWSKTLSDDAAVWTEIIPINETRDYVKHVLANAAYYEALIGNGLQLQPRPSEAPDAASASLAMSTRQ
jgi:soluble lytic murein transglycosylase